MGNKPVSNKKAKKGMILFLFLFFVLTTFTGNVFSEGSKEFNSDSRGYRSYIRYEHSDYVYMKAGEILYVGTGLYYNDDWDIKITSPNGQTSTYNVTVNGNGFIANRAQEKAGPNTINPNGYTPISYTAQSEGIYTVTYNSYDDNGAGLLLMPDDDWDYIDPRSQYSAVAWDATVVDV